MKSVIKKTLIAQQHQHTLLHLFTYVEPESWEITIFLQNYEPRRSNTVCFQALNYSV